MNRFDQNPGFRNCTEIQPNRDLIRGKNSGRFNRAHRRTHREVKDHAVYRCSRSDDFTVKYDSWIVRRMRICERCSWFPCFSIGARYHLN
jgi:hypothetical protein